MPYKKSSKSERLQLANFKKCLKWTVASREENLIPAGHCFPQILWICFIDVVLISLLISRKPVKLYDYARCFNFQFNSVQAVQHATANPLSIPSVRECGKGRPRGLNLGPWKHFMMDVWYSSYSFSLQTSSTFHHLSCCSEPERDIYHPWVHYHRASARLCLAVWSLTKHLAAFNSLTISQEVDIIPLFLKTSKRKLLFDIEIQVNGNLFHSCLVISQSLYTTINHISMFSSTFSLLKNI